MNKNRAENFAGQKRAKIAKRTRKSQKKAKPGAFWVLEGVAAVGGGCGRVRKPGKSREGKAVSTKAWRKWKDGLVSPAGSVGPGYSPPGCRPPRHAPQAGLRAHLVAKSFRTLTKKSGTAEAIPDFFWQGQKDLNPRHAVLEWMWKRRTGSGGGAVLPNSSSQPEKQRCWFGAMGNYPGQNGRKRAGNPRKNVKYY